MNAGICEASITDDALEMTFPIIVMYPTDTPEGADRLGPYPLEAARDAQPSPDRYPLAMISHGSGGSPLVYRTLARHLARSGFVVGMIEHPCNNRNDNSWEGTIRNLANRPKHLRMAIDWLHRNERLGQHIQPNAVSIIGHSLGGYTALAAAGGVPTAFAHESQGGIERRIEVMPDHRIQSLVLLAPASVWYREAGALLAVDLPILLLDAEKDPYTPPFHAQIIIGGVADPLKIAYRTIENAGHFSFLSPFPEAMVSPSFLPSQDPPGFDRVRFHERLNRDVSDFLLRHGRDE